MNTTANRPAALQPLLTASSRIAAALAVFAVMGLTALSAQQASRHAVQTATESFSRSATPVTQVTLATVQIVGRRAAKI